MVVFRDVCTQTVNTQQQHPNSKRFKRSIHQFAHFGRPKANPRPIVNNQSDQLSHSSKACKSKRIVHHYEGYANELVAQLRCQYVREFNFAYFQLFQAYQQLLSVTLNILLSYWHLFLKLFGAWLVSHFPTGEGKQQLTAPACQCQVRLLSAVFHNIIYIQVFLLLRTGLPSWLSLERPIVTECQQLQQIKQPKFYQNHRKQEQSMEVNHPVFRLQWTRVCIHFPLDYVQRMLIQKALLSVILLQTKIEKCSKVFDICYATVKVRLEQLMVFM